MSEMICKTHYEMLENLIAELESTKTELEIALRDTLAALTRANADLAAAVEVLREAWLAWYSPCQTTRDEAYEMISTLLARLEVKSGSKM